MKNNKDYYLYLLTTVLWLSLILTIQTVNAGKPLCLFTPLTPTTLTVPANTSALVSYLLTNQSKRTHTFKMRPIPGITQIVTAGNCQTNFTLQYQQTCVLSLLVTGSTMSGNIEGGPIVCDHGNPQLCYQPSLENSLNITRGAEVSYSVGGSVSGLTGTLVLDNNGEDSLTITSNGSFVFSDELEPGETYDVTVVTQPENQTCTVTNASGTIDQSDVNNILVQCQNLYSVGGDVYGLSGSLTLANQAGQTITMDSDGAFEFSGYLSGSLYEITVASQPTNQICTVNDGEGTVANEDVTDITVICSDTFYTVSGNISGLSGTVVLSNNSDNITLNADGTFTFPTPVANGADYDVTVETQPVGQICTVNNGNGTIDGANVTNVSVICSNLYYTIGGTVTGLNGGSPVILQNNGDDDLTIAQNGSFVFSTPVAHGADYTVTVFKNPGDQTCTVTNGTGTVNNVDITNVTVNCVTNTTTLTPSVSQIALSITGLSEYGVTGTPSSGEPRYITIKNNGPSLAENLTITLPSTWPTGTTATNNCPTNLPVNGACTITVVPGSTASYTTPNTPCNSGNNANLPNPDLNTIKVSADNSGDPVPIIVYILGYSCIYQGGYVFAFNDTTDKFTSVGGKAVTTQTVPTSTGQTTIVWSNVADYVYGTGTSSTPTNPNPGPSVVTPLPGQVSCAGKLDGSCNSGNINTLYYSTTTTYAARNCTQTIGEFKDWYLPAACELGYGSLNGMNCGTTTPLTQNVANMMSGKNVSFSGKTLWASTTGDASSGPNSAWAVILYNSSTPFFQFSAKTSPSLASPVLCTRSFPATS